MESQGFVVGGWNKVEGANVWRRLVIGTGYAWLGVYEACDGNGKVIADAFQPFFCVSDDLRGRKCIGGTYVNRQVAMSTADRWWSQVQAQMDAHAEAEAIKRYRERLMQLGPETESIELAIRLAREKRADEIQALAKAMVKPATTAEVRSPGKEEQAS
jgi:hypothetical protein